MSDRLHEFPTGTTVVVITFSDPELVKTYVERHNTGFDVLVDLDRAVYRSFGLERGSALRIWGWKAAKNYAEILWRQRSLRALQAPNEDTLQLGGDFVIDKEGNLAYGFWGEGPDDRPSVDDLLSAL